MLRVAGYLTALSRASGSIIFYNEDTVMQGK